MFQPKFPLEYSKIDGPYRGIKDIKEAIKQIPLTSLEITQIVYTDIDNSLIPAATRNVFAHLIDLSERKQVNFHGEISEKTKASLKIE